MIKSFISILFFTLLLPGKPSLYSSSDKPSLQLKNISFIAVIDPEIKNISEFFMERTSKDIIDQKKEKVFNYIEISTNLLKKKKEIYDAVLNQFSFKQINKKAKTWIAEDNNNLDFICFIYAIKSTFINRAYLSYDLWDVKNNEVYPYQYSFKHPPIRIDDNEIRDKLNILIDSLYTIEQKEKAPGEDNKYKKYSYTFEIKKTISFFKIRISKLSKTTKIEIFNPSGEAVTSWEKENNEFIVIKSDTSVKKGKWRIYIEY